MSDLDLNMTTIDSSQGNLDAALAELRNRLSPSGNVVSEAGRQRTIEVFGESLAGSGGGTHL